MHLNWWFWVCVGFSAGILYCMSVDNYWKYRRKIDEYKQKAQWYDEDRQRATSEKTTP